MNTKTNMFELENLFGKQHSERYMDYPLGNAFHLIIAAVEKGVGEVIIWRDMEIYSGAFAHEVHGKSFHEMFRKVRWDAVQHIIDTRLTREGEKFTLTDKGVRRDGR